MTHDLFVSTDVLAVDLIDTLVDRGYSTFVPAGTALLREAGEDISEDDFYKTFRKRYLEYSMGNYGSNEEFLEAWLVVYPKVQPKEIGTRLLQTLLDSNVQMEHANEFLEAAARRFTVVLASNHVHSWADWLIETNDWGQHFDHLHVSSACRYRKPSNGFFETLAGRYPSVPRDRITIVGDSIVNDGFGARRAGMRAIVVGGGGHRDLLPEIPRDVARGFNAADSVANGVNYGD